MPALLKVFKRQLTHCLWCKGRLFDEYGTLLCLNCGARYDPKRLEGQVKTV